MNYDPESPSAGLGGELEPAVEAATASVRFGIWLIAIGLFALYFATDIHRLAMSDKNDPGPRAVPIAMSLALLIGGVVQVCYGWYSSATETPAAGRRDGLLLAAALLVYLAVVPWVGFYPPTLVFAFLMSWRAGARWWVGLLTASIILIVIRVLFEGLFRVQLPRGELSGWY